MNNTDLKTAFEETGEQLDRIILAFRRGVPLPHPETIVWYSNDTLSSLNIEGELGENSIPDKTNVVKAEIGTAVTSIGNHAFSYCSRLTSVTIPDGVTSIGNNAFNHCSGLTSITIPDGVTSIENAAFSYCSGLTSITIPDGVTSIGGYAFLGCSKLTSVTIPDSVTSIGVQAFKDCSELTSVTIPDSVTNIGTSAFSGCKALSSITSLRNSAPTVQSYTFGDSDSKYTGRNTYSTENNVLKVPQGAIGYDKSYWLNPLQHPDKCGFHIEYI